MIRSLNGDPEFDLPTTEPKCFYKCNCNNSLSRFLDSAGCVFKKFFKTYFLYPVIDSELCLCVLTEKKIEQKQNWKTNSKTIKNICRY